MSQGMGIRDCQSKGRERMISMVRTGLNIFVYTHSGCPGGERALRYFTHHGLAASPRDIAQDVDARREFLALGCIGTPVILIGGEKFIGFDEPTIEQTLVAMGLLDGA